ncbi:MAG: 2-amino-4-hydroxy-6-hydroxymethyldihydropteridine diphosphokinase [Deltaproteobacteria bacterium]|nr:2-amino-4-hydroxy-6-hydroxymethyldihydropteridine diphosphokinase [Deltaproteobacteria bacterium]
MDSTTHSVCIGLGSNMDDREANLREAIDRLRPLIVCEALSDIFETEPVGSVEQGWFLNMALRGTTGLEPFDLLAALQGIEEAMGRTRLIDKGPRIIDVDILLYSSTIVRTKELTVPHPELHCRAFVLTPLTQIAPDWLHPVLNKTVQQLSDELQHDKAVRIWTRNA